MNTPIKPQISPELSGGISSGTNGLSRRDFIGLAVGAGATLALQQRMFGAPMVSAPATDAVRVGIVGLHNKGNSHLGELLKLKGARVVALCDVDSEVLAKRVAGAAKAGAKVVAHRDFRKMLEMKDLDAVVIATPNHHHTLQAIWACQAGKDVYVEKPVSHDLFESAQIAVVAEKFGRVVQAGTQKRSDPGLAAVFEYLRGGNLGKILLVRGFCYRFRPSIGKCTGPLKIPASVDYNLWCGPAPMGPIYRKQFHYDWHWFWDTGNGEIGNQGPHELDLCRWALGEKGLPRRVLSFGGRFGYDDDGQTPNTHLAVFDYPTAPLLFEVRGLPMKPGMDVPDAYRGVRVGLVVECENGSFVGGAGGGWVYDKSGKKVKQFSGDGGGGHMRNFIDCVKAHDPAKINGKIREGAISSGLAHLANVAHQVGGAYSPEACAERLKANPQALASVGALIEHLKTNAVDLGKKPPVLGGWLEWSDAELRFTGGAGAEQANALVRRKCRAGFEVPEYVSKL